MCSVFQLSIVLEETSESTELHATTHKCLTSGWPLFAPRNGPALLTALESRLTAEGRRNVLVIDLILSSISTHFGVGSDEKETGNRLYHVILEYVKGVCGIGSAFFCITGL